MLYFFFFLPSLLFVLVTLLSTIICAFFVSYFKERCSFAILVRKKKKPIHANPSPIAFLAKSNCFSELHIGDTANVLSLTTWFLKRRRSWHAFIDLFLYSFTCLTKYIWKGEKNEKKNKKTTTLFCAEK